ncbi:eukaryotic translation initiation factor 3 subunit M-like [Olea europaea subsp. europaea]|uniref:Eukaryotic translation initiation factor 3 subunit M-like n=1 Tax=Olea europaea subsp. europaea TaxID=158383 RepID=A0A8S0RGQ4_OLEEU|nr:eukaryotic translation initiation factor 3 subunit M-like [Olea europaea subsp. europaea]
MSEAKEEAVKTIVEFVKAPDIFQGDLLDVPAVAQLEKDAKYAQMYQLLNIFLTQRLDAYLDFYTANSALLKSFGLVQEDCIEKMRLVWLLSLGTNESPQIPASRVKYTFVVVEFTLGAAAA